MLLNHFSNIYFKKNKIIKMLLIIFSNFFLIKKKHFKNITKSF